MVSCALGRVDEVLIRGRSNAQAVTYDNRRFLAPATPSTRSTNSQPIPLRTFGKHQHPSNSRRHDGRGEKGVKSYRDGTSQGRKGEGEAASERGARAEEEGSRGQQGMYSASWSDRD